MELENVKKDIVDRVEKYRKELIALSLQIHGDPEVGWYEDKASGWIVDYLAKHEFKTERGICDLPTSFRATFGQGKPVIAFLAEYDALPDIGHGCGHNIIACSAVGAGIGAKVISEQTSCTIVVIGTPAEELLGGKVIMTERGAFNGIDVAMMVHPRAQHSPVGLKHLAAISLDVDFWGKAAHAASAPWEGLNALEAMIQSFVSINSLRQHMRERSRVHGIIKDGGKAPNVIPEHASGTFMIRAVDDLSLEKLCGKVLECMRGAAISTRTRLEYKYGLKCSAMQHNSVLVRLWADNMRALGQKVDSITESPGSIDMGNVSRIVPSIHPFIAISSDPVAPHSIEFANAAASDVGNNATIDAAKALAMTAADVIFNPTNLEEIKKEFVATLK